MSEPILPISHLQILFFRGGRHAGRHAHGAQTAAGKWTPHNRTPIAPRSHLSHPPRAAPSHPTSQLPPNCHPIIPQSPPNHPPINPQLTRINPPITPDQPPTNLECKPPPTGGLHTPPNHTPITHPPNDPPITPLLRPINPPIKPSVQTHRVTPPD